MIVKAFAASLFALTSVGVAAPMASPPPSRIAPGVTVSGIRVGGLTAEPARVRVRKAFERPVRFRFDDQRWRRSPLALGASTAVGAAVTRALTSRPREDVRLRVRVDAKKLRRYVAGLDRRISRPAEDATVTGLTSSLTPIISDGREGLQVDRGAMTRRVARALKNNVRKPIPMAVRFVQPAVTRENFGPVIVIRRDSHQLTLFNGESTVRTLPVATGQAQYPTPLGTWSIVDMQVNPWWRPPSSDWAKGLKPIPPGPGNPLGTRWMGLSAPGVGIHATPDDASIGYSASHGCIRMHVADAEWLFGQVRIGAPVFIVGA